MWKLLVILGLVFVLASATAFADDINTAGPVPAFVIQFMTNDTGSPNLTADYSGQAVNISFSPSAGTIIRIQEFAVILEDANINNEGQYGGINELTNGLHIYAILNGTRIDIDNDIHITHNGQFRYLFSEIELDDLTGGNDWFKANFHFHDTGTTLRLVGDTNDTFIIQIQDDFTGLNEQRFTITGFNETEFTTGFGTPDPSRDEMSFIALAIILIGILFFVHRASVTIPDKYWQLKMGFFFGAVAIAWASANIALRIAIDSARSASLQSNLETFYLAYNTMGILSVLFIGLILLRVGFGKFRDVALIVLGRKPQEDDNSWNDENDAANQQDENDDENEARNG